MKSFQGNRGVARYLLRNTKNLNVKDDSSRELVLLATKNGKSHSEFTLRIVQKWLVYFFCRL